MTSGKGSNPKFIKYKLKDKFLNFSLIYLWQCINHQTKMKYDLKQMYFPLNRYNWSSANPQTQLRPMHRTIQKKN